MDGYDPMGTHYLTSPLALNTGATTDDYMNILPPMGMPDQSNNYNSGNYVRYEAAPPRDKAHWWLTDSPRKKR